MIRRVLRAAARLAREAWDGKADAYRELQETRLQLEQQREYMAYLIRTAPAVLVRIKERWHHETEQRRCLALWHRAHQEHCRSRWKLAQGRVIAPIPLRREVAR